MGGGVREPRTRTTGSEAGDVAIVDRTEASVETYDKVRAFQAGLKITPLSAWGSEPPPVTGSVDASVDDETEPLRQVFAMDADRFFGYASELLRS